MINDKKVLYIILLILFAVVVVFFLYKKEKPAVKEDVVWDESSINFSRVSFFNASNHRASLGIPDYWEGRYRMKDEGNTVYFLNIEDPGDVKEIFRIKSFKKDDFKPEEYKEWRDLGEKEAFVFLYKLSTASEEETEKNNSFEKMLSETDNIIKTFDVN